MKASSEGVLIVVLIMVGYSIGEFVIWPLLNPKHGSSSEQPPVQISAGQAYQIGYKQGVQAAIWGCHSRTNKEVYYVNEIEWRAAEFHNIFGGLLRTNGPNREFWMLVPVNTNYLEYRKEEWPTNTP